MSYANGTTHYNLPQTVGTDKRDWFDSNAAFAAVDAALYAAATGQASDAEAITALQQTVAGQATDIATLQTASSSQAASISALQTSVSGLATNVADVRQDAEDMITANNEGAAATSTRVYAIGDYFIYNDVLYKATAAIAIGDTIVPNTNCVATNIDTELTQVNSELNKGSVSITADGVKTLTQILDSLFALADTSKITINSKLRTANGVCSCTLVGGTIFDFSAVSSPVIIDTYRIKASNSIAHRVSCNSNNTIQFEDRGATTPESGRVFTLYY